MTLATRLFPLGQAASYVDRILKGEKPAAIEGPMSALGQKRIKVFDEGMQVYDVDADR
jgi:hypothetical protein